MKIFLVSMLVAVAAIGLVAGGAAAVDAHFSGGENPSIVERLAERFGLDESEVETFFDEIREERYANKEIRAGERLDQAIQDGLITEEQKQLLLDKKAELKADYQALNDLQPEERHERTRELHTEMKAWLEANDIDFGGFKSGLGHHRGFGHKLH